MSAFYRIEGIPLRLTRSQAAAYYAQQGYPPVAITALLPGMSVGAIRQALLRERKRGTDVPTYTLTKRRA